MQYFKHMSNMRNDSKIRRLISRYGLEGYGLYNIIVESIAESLSSEDPIPELEETCEDIASFYNADTARINEITNFMINQGLFELSETSDRVLCNKIYKFLQTSQTRSEQIKKLIKNYTLAQQKALLPPSQTVSDMNNGDNVDVSQTVSDKTRPSQREQTRPDQTKPEQTIIDKEKKEEDEISTIVWKSQPKLSRQTWATFEKYYDAFIPDISKQTDAINKIMHLATECGDPEIVVLSMMKKLQELKESDDTKKGFWRTQPFLPSTLVSLWTRIREHIKTEVPDDIDWENLNED